MRALIYIAKNIVIFLLTFLLGAQTTYAKTEFVLLSGGVNISELGDFTKKIKTLPDEINVGSSVIKNELKANWRLITGLEDLAKAGGDWLTPNLLSKLDGFGDALLKQKFLDDFAGASAQTKILLNNNPKLVKAWKIPSKHGDALATDVPFLTKLSDDITNPQFPNGSSATAAQLEAALDNQAIFNFYKKFHDSPDLGDLMRQRYLEAATLPDAAARKAILESVLDQKAAIRGLGHLSDDLLENLSRSNLADGTATFTSANGSTVQIDFLSVSGVQPSQTLISEGATVIGGKSVVPKAGSNSTRYFKWTNSQRAQDSEAKIIEYVMDQVASARGINIPQGANKADYIDDVLDGANLQIVIKSEMEACSSCADVISSFNNANATPIDFSGGTKFYEQYGG